jgi:hypothetical protein
MLKDYKIKSLFLKELIKSKSYSNPDDLEYILDLTFLEKSISDGIHGLAHGYLIEVLKNKYEFEFLQILKEINPKLYKKELKEREQKLLNKEEVCIIENKNKNQKKEKKKKKEILENWWLSNGGKV